MAGRSMSAGTGTGAEGGSWVLGVRVCVGVGAGEGVMVVSGFGRLLCSIPRWVLIDAYRAVPVRFLFSRYGMCWCVFGSRYFFARPV